jgi:hypothetical protein
MNDTFLVIIRDGMWQSGYEPHGMPYAFVSTRYTLEPIGGDPIPPDGHYRGIIVSDGILRLVSGGEFAYGMMMNQTLRDYKATFDDAFHDEFLAGVTRAIKGSESSPIETARTSRAPSWTAIAMGVGCERHQGAPRNDLQTVPIHPCSPAPDAV